MSGGGPDGKERESAAATLLKVYAQILFSRSPAVGLLLLLATATSPRAFTFGLLAVTTATAAAWLLDLESDAVLDGSYGYNALLLGLGIGQTFSGFLPAVGAAVVAAVASVLVTAALRSLLGGGANLPVLSLPFVGIFYLTLGASSFSGLVASAHEPADAVLTGSLPAPLVSFVQSLGALFFLPREGAGLLVLAALLLHSRISALLAVVSFATLTLLDAYALSLPAGTVEILGYNVILTGVALGGAWFVPSATSFLLAITGALLCTLLSAGLMVPLARLGAPLLIVPFNATMLLVLTAMRRRTHDRLPKSVDFVPGTPEQNLSYFRTRRARFRRLHPVALRMPFRGSWVCTQAVDGAITHQGIWRHAFDFEVRGEDGRLHRDDGATLDQYHAYRLPVLAAAAGTVVKVESGIADNPVGEINVEQNWGNYVLIYHAPGLYSLVAHLARGSVKVREGEHVQPDHVVGLCGNSGRSAQPHIHFHLQSTPVLGGATVPCQFNDVVVERRDGAHMEPAFEPREGDATRNMSECGDIAEYFAFSYGDTWTYETGKGTERITCDVDVLGNFLLRSLDREASLYFGKDDAFFTAHDALGEPSSVLHALRAALSRVPFEANASLTWVDYLPARGVRPWPLRVLMDFVSPLLPSDAIELTFRMRRAGRRLVIEGRSRRYDRRGAPVVQTRVELAKGAGPTRFELVVRGRSITAERARPALQELTLNQEEAG